ncbi:TPA: type VI secretion system lipoprotein TssJ [Vibrio cholerae]|nr:type VI secretion system lipoprotein TssJ [Vibrio cholerae]
MKKIKLVLLSLCLFSGCSIWGRDTAPLLMVEVIASTNINPNLEGKPSPVEVRVYQLKDSEAFNQADFLQLYSDEQGTLKAAMIATRHLPSTLPGESKRASFNLNAETKFVGIVVGFADFREAKNKAIYQIQKSESTSIQISLDGINVTVTSGEQ